MRYKSLEFSEIYAIKQIIDSILNKEYYCNNDDKSRLNKKHLYIINKNWIIKTKNFMDYYITALEKPSSATFNTLRIEENKLFKPRYSFPR